MPRKTYDDDLVAVVTVLTRLDTHNALCYNEVIMQCVISGDQHKEGIPWARK